jgi:hypothetical protein
MMLLEDSQANPLSFSGSQETKNPPLFTPSEKSALFGQALNTNLVSGLTGPIGLAIQPVPESSTYALFGLGTLALLIAARRRMA